MKRICVILIDFTFTTYLYKALDSLRPLSPHIDSVVILQNKAELSPSFINHQHPFSKVVFHQFNSGEISETINHIASTIRSEYILFLKQPEYILPIFPMDIIQSSFPIHILGYKYRHKDITVEFPLIIQTKTLRNEPLLSTHQLPFKEALLPAWLSAFHSEGVQFEENLVKRARDNNARNQMEKLKFLEKYRQKKTLPRKPTITVIMANYNMEKYVEAAIVSCLLQSESPDQILLIDDGSTDDSLKQMRNWEGDSIKVFCKQNEGKAKALNDILPHVDTDFILELDADDWLDPNAISVIKDHLINLPGDVAVLYGNLRRWKQLNDDVQFKSNAAGRRVRSKKGLLGYRFPLGPRIYRTSSLKAVGGFPVIQFNSGRLFEDVSLLNLLISQYQFQYENFTVYNVREHSESITRKNDNHWQDFLKNLE